MKSERRTGKVTSGIETEAAGEWQVASRKREKPRWQALMSEDGRGTARLSPRFADDSGRASGG
jgi:hypothetical protein